MHRIYPKTKLLNFTIRWRPDQLADAREIASTVGMSFADTMRTLLDAALRERRRLKRRAPTPTPETRAGGW